MTTWQPLKTPHPNTETTSWIPPTPLRRNVHNPHARATHNYNLIDNLVQSSAPMLVLEVLHNFPSQRKALLSQLGVVDPTNTHLITFDLDNMDPRLPSLVSFHIPFKIRNTTVHWCIIDKGASTCIMSKTRWQQISSPKLVPLVITLISYDGWPSQP